jgi:signal transduction histidine kinase
MVRALAQTALDLPFGIVNFTLTITLLAVTVGLLITFPLALPVGWLLFVSSVGLGRVARSRVAALCGVDLPDPHPPLESRSWFRRLWERTKTPSRWREILYLLASLPVGIAAFVATMVAWAGSLSLVALPAYVSSLPGGTAEFGLFDVGSGVGVWLLAAVGIVGLLVGAPWLTIAMANADGALARRLLAPPRTEQLEAEVARLDRSRVAAVDSAEAERRRIERDLHDGAQQRLVKLGMDLGMASERFDSDPESARQLLADAHGEAKAALVELRDLVRGFHPAILEDRGLDAALSAVVARAAVPVTLRVDVRDRPPAAVESTAYFVVVETLTNVAKHAHATKAAVSIERRGDRLAIDVTDDGEGGAAAANGSGLHGLEERVHALGGWMQVLSPAGGPTSVLVELPCGS